MSLSAPAEVEFSSGSGIQVLGIIPNGTTLIRANYTIDNKQPFLREETGLTEGSLGHQVLFQTFDLSNEDHNIVINAINATSARPYTISSIKTYEPAHVEHKKNTGAVVGGVIGGLIALLLIVTGCFYVWRRRRQSGYSRRIIPLTTQYAQPAYQRPPSGTLSFCFSFSHVMIIQLAKLRRVLPVCRAD